MILDHRHHNHRRRLLLDAGPTRPQNNVSRMRSYASEANFDTNMVIILVALLCALICVLGLNSIMRCALRCSRRFTFETTDQTASGLASTGLKKSTLRQIPVVVYGSGSNIPTTECPICLGEFLDGEKVRLLPRCRHGFHVKCIDTWLVSHSSCPTCRQSLLGSPDDPEAVAVTVAEGGHSSRQQVTVSVLADEVG